MKVAESVKTLIGVADHNVPKIIRSLQRARNVTEFQVGPISNPIVSFTMGGRAFRVVRGDYLLFDEYVTKIFPPILSADYTSRGFRSVRPDSEPLLFGHLRGEHFDGTEQQVSSAFALTVQTLGYKPNVARLTPTELQHIVNAATAYGCLYLGEIR